MGEDEREVAGEPGAPERPLYLVSEAAWLAGTTAAALSRWISPFKVTRHYAEPKELRPLIITPPPPNGDRLLSFVNLIEAHFIVQYRRLGLPLDAVRRGVTYAREQFGDEHPLRTRRFMTDGANLFADIQKAEGMSGLVSFSAGGQIAWPEAIKEFLHSIDYDETDRAMRWWLRGRNKFIFVDPRFEFGRPVVHDKLIRTEILVERFEAGEPVDEVAEDFGIPEAVVEEAIRFELSKAA